MVKCTFCSSDISPGTGLIFVKNDGRQIYFCSSKCRKNMIHLGRKPGKYKWSRQVSKQ